MSAQSHKKPDRLYQEIARKLETQFSGDEYKYGDRLPSERELAIAHNVSRPTIREAMIALELQGLVEVRVGAGAYLSQKPGHKKNDIIGPSAFELTEARLLIEGEAAALAAPQISEKELAHLDRLVKEIANENARNQGTVDADYEFHRVIALATRNQAIVDIVDRLWTLRARSPATALLYAKARSANVMPVVDEHKSIVEALRSGKPEKARAAMQAHLSAVLESLLFGVEERAVEEARQSTKQKRDLYSRVLS